MSTPALPEASYWPPPPIDVVERTDTTPTKRQHAKDHNDLQTAVNAMLLVLGQRPFGQGDDLSAELVRLQDLITGLTTAQAGTQAQVVEALVDAQQALVELAELAAEVAALAARPLPRLVHSQTFSADVWHVAHGLGYDPVVDVVSSDGYRVLGFGLEYAVDRMSLNVSFSLAITGRVLLAN